MSRELFRHRLSRVQVHPNDLKWMPVWLDEYARPQNAADGQVLVVDAESVLTFLRGLQLAGGGDDGVGAGGTQLGGRRAA